MASKSTTTAANRGNIKTYKTYDTEGYDGYIIYQNPEDSSYLMAWKCTSEPSWIAEAGLATPPEESKNIRDIYTKHWRAFTRWKSFYRTQSELVLNEYFEYTYGARLDPELLELCIKFNKLTRDEDDFMVKLNEWQLYFIYNLLVYLKYRKNKVYHKETDTNYSYAERRMLAVYTSKKYPEEYRWTWMD